METTKNNARRLIMTESSYMSAQAELEVYKELDVELYRILATLDKLTSDICEEMDGKVFPVSEFRPGVTANPFHPHCRTTTVPYFDDDFGERAARDEDGETYYVPSDMSYPEWKQTFADGGGKSGLTKIGESGIIDTGGDVVFDSEKAKEIINNQKPMDSVVIERVKNALAGKGVVLEQSENLDRWLISKGAEATTFSDGTMVMHTNVSASGFYEELIHYGQIQSGRAIPGNDRNNLLMEIEAKERLIKNQKAYGITDYEVEILQEVLEEYKLLLQGDD